MALDDGQFGDSLRTQRQTAGLTQRELAVRAGVSVRAVRYWENGHINTPRMASRQLIQRVLDGAPPRACDRVRIGVLGPLVVHGRSRELGLLRPKAAALFALVAIQPNNEVSRDEIVDVLWDGRPPSSHVRLIRGHGDAVRRMLGPTVDLVSVGRGGYRLRVERDQIDVLEFTALAGRAAAAYSMGDVTRAFELYAASLACWRGSPLVGFDRRLRDHPATVALTARYRAAESVLSSRTVVGMQYSGSTPPTLPA
ncbi:transcriptional activator [Kutzneria buriramensis]|uniref:Transcriptional activator n=1 Tax=Kutzneria buriramensis TaxID=1045776 RepID=A0A3E0HF15_9PSEU|nr:transcriptional activator [Kutzneria buriramensis]